MADQECEQEACEWDRHAQAFRWFPELGLPVGEPAVGGGRSRSDHDDPAGCARATAG